MELIILIYYTLRKHLCLVYKGWGLQQLSVIRLCGQSCNLQPATVADAHGYDLHKCGLRNKRYSPR